MDIVAHVSDVDPSENINDYDIYIHLKYPFYWS